MRKLPSVRPSGSTQPSHSYGFLLRQNWKSGLTVSLVNIPLSISLAVAANATPLMGIVTAIWAGLVAAAIAGSKFNIVGPTGALSGILASYALTHGVETLPWLAVAVGVLTLIVYALRWEKYISFIPASVIHGFTLGVAFIIALNQLNFALGLTGLPIHEHFTANVLESLQHIGAAQMPAVVISLTGFAFLLIWMRLVPSFPGAIILAAVGIGVGMLASNGTLDIPLQTLQTKFGEQHLRLFMLPSFSTGIVNIAFVSAALTVTVIAILETLISAKIADGMTKTKFRRRREVLGLGLANIASGIAGGIPATAALARTALNVKSGASHQLSAQLNGVFTMVISVALFSYFQHLPLPIVASILVFVAYRMVEAEHFVRLLRHDRLAFFLSLVVALLTVLIDPIIGILVGATISLLIFVNSLSEGQAEITTNKKGSILARMTAHIFRTKKPQQGDLFVYRFAGPLTYLNALSHVETLDHVHEPHTVILSMRNLHFMDIDGLDALEDIVETLEHRGMRVALSGVSEFVHPLLEHAKFFRRKEKGGLVFRSTSDAVAALKGKP